MKNVFLAWSLMLMLMQGCTGTCDPIEPEVYFKTIRKLDNRPLIGTTGSLPVDSIQLFLIRIIQTDTTIVNVTHTSLILSEKKDSIIGIKLNENEFNFFINYGTFDRDTLSFNLQQRGKNFCKGYDYDFFYNTNQVCSVCNAENIHTIIKQP